MGTRRTEWTWTQDDSRPLDFAVQVLVRDGMRVDGFRSHAPGHGRHRAAGLTAALWRSWVAELARHHETESLQVGPEHWKWFVEPWSLFAESELQTSIRLHWEEYTLMRSTWATAAAPPGRGLAHDQLRRLWVDLSSWYRSLSTLRVYVVAYPVPAVFPIPPTSALVAPSGDQREYEDQIKNAARLLVRSAEAAS